MKITLKWSIQDRDPEVAKKGLKTVFFRCFLPSKRVKNTPFSKTRLHAALEKTLIFHKKGVKMVKKAWAYLNRICAIRPGDFLPILSPWDLKLTNLAVLQTHWHSGALPGVTNSGPVFEPRATMNHYMRLQCASFLMVLAREITSHLTMG